MPKYYPINEEAAKRAKDMNSFSDYQPGSATAGYRAMVDEAYAAAERQKARVDPMYHDKILRPEDGTSPYQLQPFVKRENKEMSR